MAIHMAAQCNRAETVQYLVEEAGVGVDTVSGGTALQHVACNYTHSLQQDTDGLTPLMLAALFSGRETARFLLSAGASTNVLTRS